MRESLRPLEGQKPPRRACLLDIRILRIGAGLCTGHRGILSLERFAEATREIRRRDDPTGVLSKLGIPLAACPEANARRTRRTTEDPALAERFRKVAGPGAR